MEIFTGQNEPPVLLTPVANLPPVSTTSCSDAGGKFATGVVDNATVVHLDLGISPRIFEKFQNDFNQTQKSRNTVPLIMVILLETCFLIVKVK